MAIVLNTQHSFWVSRAGDKRQTVCSQIELPLREQLSGKYNLAENKSRFLQLRSVLVKRKSAMCTLCLAQTQLRAL